MERKVSAEMQEPPLCLLCGQRPPCPHVPLVPKKGANRLAHWVRSQLLARPQPTHTHDAWPPHASPHCLLAPNRHTHTRCMATTCRSPLLTRPQNRHTHTTHGHYVPYQPMRSPPDHHLTTRCLQVGNQVELQHSYSRLAYTGVRPQHKHGRVLAQVIGLDTVSDMRLRVKVLGGIVVAHDENDPTADAAILAERRKLKHILHGAPLLVPQNPVGTRDPELRATVKQLGIMGMAEPVSKRKIVWHHTLKGTDPEVSERAVVVRPPGERNGALMTHKKAGGKSPKGSTSSRPKTLALPSPERGGSGSARSLRGGTSRRSTSARSSGTASPTSPVRRASSPKKSASQAALLEKSSSVGAIDAID